MCDYRVTSNRAKIATIDDCRYAKQINIYIYIYIGWDGELHGEQFMIYACLIMLIQLLRLTANRVCDAMREPPPPLTC